MKIVKLMPINKSGGQNLFNNYGPISCYYNFPNYWKSCLKKTCLLNDSQYSFRYNISTSFALLKLNEDIASLLDRNLIIISMFQIGNTFDTIDHNILIKKAEHMGLRGIA